MNIQFLSVEKLRMSLAHLRSQVPPRYFQLQQLPIRVVCCAGELGFFEVVDGFKRVRSAQDNGIQKIATVVEDVSGPEVKALLIRANASVKTLTPLDESRVIRSLIEEDKLSLAKAARILRRGRPWASKRYALIKRLAVSLHKPVDEGRLSVSVAYALTSLGKQEQANLARIMMAAGLSATNGLAFVSTYRMLDSDGERRVLLEDPLGTLQEMRMASRQSSPVLSSVACRRQERYRQLGELLDEFVNEEPGSLTTGEARLLQAERKSLTAKIMFCAQALSKSAARACQVPAI